MNSNRLLLILIFDKYVLSFCHLDNGGLKLYFQIVNRKFEIKLKYKFEIELKYKFEIYHCADFLSVKLRFITF